MRFNINLANYYLWLNKKFACFCNRVKFLSKFLINWFIKTKWKNLWQIFKIENVILKEKMNKKKKNLWVFYYLLIYWGLKIRNKGVSTYVASFNCLCCFFSLSNCEIIFLYISISSGCILFKKSFWLREAVNNL